MKNNIDNNNEKFKHLALDIGLKILRASSSIDSNIIKGSFLIILNEEEQTFKVTNLEGWFPELNLLDDDAESEPSNKGLEKENSLKLSKPISKNKIAPHNKPNYVG